MEKSTKGIWNHRPSPPGGEDMRLNISFQCLRYMSDPGALRLLQPYQAHNGTFLSSEPVGGSIPKLSGLVAHAIDSRETTPVCLQCPAQGAPLPAFRSVESPVGGWERDFNNVFKLLEGCPSLASV